MSEHAPDIDEVLSALSEPIRRRLLDLIATHGEATATTISAELPITRQAVAKHLTVLEDAGLVAARRQGRDVLYTLQPAPSPPPTGSPTSPPPGTPASPPSNASPKQNDHPARTIPFLARRSRTPNRHSERSRGISLRSHATRPNAPRATQSKPAACRDR
ncbi:MAG: hypothetical protein QOJ59_2503 [Thermomicrobiales bacterium]|nr:hypothetical protein [Thermomicrobiales bacterium]